MKRLWIVPPLLGLVVALCVGSHLYQKHQIDDILVRLECLEQACRQGDIPTHQAAAIAEDWQRISRRMSLYIPHDQLAESQETAALLPALLRKGGEEEFYMEVYRLREQLLHLRQIDDPLPHNIL